MPSRSARIIRILSLLLILGLAACAAQPRSITYRATPYSYTAAQGDVRVYTRSDGQTLTIQALEDGAQVTVGEQSYRVSGSPRQVAVTFPDGRVLTADYEPDSIRYGATEIESQASLEDWDTVDALRAVAFAEALETSAGPGGGQILLAIVLLGLGLLELLNPRLAWQIAEGWRYANLEPSDAYLYFSRLAGAVLIIIALFVIFGGLSL